MNSLLYKNSLVSRSILASAKSKTIVQPKLSINVPGDQYEQEADEMAERVMRMPANENNYRPKTGIIGASLQRKCTECEEEEKRRKPIMRKAEAGNSGMSVSSSFATSLNASKGGGSPLSPDIKSFMENAFSTDFSRVRLYTGQQATSMNKAINSEAFTYGPDIYFNERTYSPYTNEGRRLLAHELTHVCQQNNFSPIQIRRFTTDDCSQSDHEIIDKADSKAVSILNKTIRILRQFISDSRAGNENPVLEDIFARYFGIAEASYAEIMLTSYKRILNKLAEDDYQYECEDDCDNENAYVYSFWSDIHLCMNNIRNNGNLIIARTIIHEMSHYVTDTDDLAYCKQDNRCPISLHYLDAISNADSYACFAHDVYTTL